MLPRRRALTLRLFCSATRFFRELPLSPTAFHSKRLYKHVSLPCLYHNVRNIPKVNTNIPPP